jgi:hypothetical protein
LPEQVAGVEHGGLLVSFSTIIDCLLLVVLVIVAVLSPLASLLLLFARSPARLFLFAFFVPLGNGLRDVARREGLPIVAHFAELEPPSLGDVLAALCPGHPAQRGERARSREEERGGGKRASWS